MYFLTSKDRKVERLIDKDLLCSATDVFFSLFLSLTLSLEFSLLSLSVWGLCDRHLFWSLGQLQGGPERLPDGHSAEMGSRLHQQDGHCNGGELFYCSWDSWTAVKEINSESKFVCTYPGERKWWQGCAGRPLEGTVLWWCCTISMDWQRTDPAAVEQGRGNSGQIWPVLGVCWCRLHRWDFDCSHCHMIQGFKR